MESNSTHPSAVSPQPKRFCSVDYNVNHQKNNIDSASSVKVSDASASDSTINNSSFYSLSENKPSSNIPLLQNCENETGTKYETILADNQEIHSVLDETSPMTSDCEDDSPISLVLDKAKFWEGLKVHIERPHILNRRLCGVVDIWWGVKVYGELPENSHLSFLALTSSLWTLLNKNTLEGGNTTFSKVSESSSIEEEVKSLLIENGFESTNMKNSHSEAMSALTESSDCCYVVIRKAMPKVQDRYSTVTEVLFLDGRSDSCYFLSTVCLPPLLPSRGYVISCVAPDSEDNTLVPLHCPPHGFQCSFLSQTKGKLTI